MSLSKEYSEYHLTSQGWVEGSFHGDCFGGRIIRQTPTDRYLTLVITDELFVHSHMSRITDHVAWESDDKKMVKLLLKKFGSRPINALPLTT